jgi:hypothetical protein
VVKRLWVRSAPQILFSSRRHSIYSLDSFSSTSSSTWRKPGAAKASALALSRVICHLLVSTGPLFFGWEGLARPPSGVLSSGSNHYLSHLVLLLLAPGLDSCPGPRLFWPPSVLLYFGLCPAACVMWLPWLIVQQVGSESRFFFWQMRCSMKYARGVRMCSEKLCIDFFDLGRYKSILVTCWRIRGSSICLNCFVLPLKF